ncbi:calcium-dependent protein kinase 29-like [Anneissia japonica]|uniref:calcium-dependent protein kinase 29-like n=1 Tax=Anneissia japonica TaxID=1529436 RepID=UPI00142555BB|nr:calcium-dependent protein kinase 29-like [Anneissia japonica]
MEMALEDLFSMEMLHFQEYGMMSCHQFPKEDHFQECLTAFYLTPLTMCNQQKHRHQKSSHCSPDDINKLIIGIDESRKHNTKKIADEEEYDELELSRRGNHTRGDFIKSGQDTESHQQQPTRRRSFLNRVWQAVIRLLCIRGNNETTNAADNNRQTAKVDKIAENNTRTQPDVTPTPNQLLLDSSSVSALATPVELGSGSFGRVNLMTSNILGYHHLVAVKRASMKSYKDPEDAWNQMCLEARVMEFLSGLPSFPDVYGVFREGNECRMVQEFIGDNQTYTSTTLLSVMKTGRPTITGFECITMTSEVAKGLHEMHRRGLLHNDVAARNILICHNGIHFTAKLTDFGMANVDADFGREDACAEGLVANPKS